VTNGRGASDTDTLIHSNSGRTIKKSLFEKLQSAMSLRRAYLVRVFMIFGVRMSNQSAAFPAIMSLI
jgi:hypothetical protein